MGVLPSPLHRMHSIIHLLAAVLALGQSSPLPPIQASKEILTNSLVALKSKPIEEKAESADAAAADEEGQTARQKRSGVAPFSGQFGSLNIDHQDADQVASAAAVLAKYIKDTGDQEGVVEFLQFMVKSGKLSPKEVIVYVNKVMENLQEVEELEESQNHREVDDLQKNRHAVQAKNERKQLEEIHNNKINKLDLEKKSLTQTKEEIEKKIVELQNQKSKEEEEFKKRQILAKEVEEGEKDNETILKINDFLEEQKKLAKISKNLYMHVKEALIETTVDNLSKITSDTSA